MTFVLLPEVNVSGGRSVHPVQDAGGNAAAYDDPLQAALQWQRAGADWIRLVDRDADSGRGSRHALLAEIVGKLDVPVELAGGIRDDESLAAALDTGCARVTLAPAALERPDWCAVALSTHGERIAVELDVRPSTLTVRSPTPEGSDLFEVVKRLDADGCCRYVVSDVERDGASTGPTLELLRRLCTATDRPLIVNGGVSAVDDLRALAELAPLGVEGAVLGEELHSGGFTLPEALAAVR